MSSNRDFKRIAPDFDGSPSRHRDWMNKFELAARAAKYTDEDKCLHAPLHFEGDAWRWYQGRLTEEIRNSWALFKTAFLEEFRGSNWQQNLLQHAMNRLQFPNEPVDRYLNDKLDILDYLGDEATESTKVALLISGLQHRLQPYVRMMAPTSLASAISAIRTVAESFSDQAPPTAFDSRPRGAQFNYDGPPRNDVPRSYNDSRDNRANYQTKRPWQPPFRPNNNPNSIPVNFNNRDNYNRRPNADSRQQPSGGRSHESDGRGRGTDSDLAKRLERLSLNRAYVESDYDTDEWNPRKSGKPTVRLLNLDDSDYEQDYDHSEYDSDDEGDSWEEEWTERVKAFVKRSHEEGSSRDEGDDRHRARKISRGAFPSDIEMDNVPARRRYNIRRNPPAGAQGGPAAAAPPPPPAPIPEQNRARKPTPKKRRKPHEYDIIKALSETPANATLLEVIQLKPTMLNDVKHTLYDYIPREPLAEASHADVENKPAPTTTQVVASGKYGTAKVKGKLNGKDGSFIVDTGATNTIATIDTAEEYNLKCAKVDRPIPYHTSGEALGEVVAIARGSLIQIGDVGIRVDIYVVKSKGFKVLIGNEWLHAARAKIDFDALTITVSANGKCSTLPLKVRREESNSRTLEGRCADVENRELNGVATPRI
ncbi:hypothetical protein HDU93_003849, partial [Gonapodya sp. JEL0774]